MAARATSIVLPLLVAILAVYLQWPLQTITPAWEAVFPRSLNRRAIAHDATRNLSWIGTVDEGIELFQSVFYAEDTGGANRFRPPVLLEHARDSTLDATAPGAVCPQGRGDAVFPFSSPTWNTSEDCLHLQIGRPRHTPAGARLPVLVYLHGGGDILGAGADQMYRPHGLVKLSVTNQQPVIFVGVHYRLGLFGFAASEALKDEKAMNNGLRDQRAAFDWIQEHIAAFGGDPGRVTAVGQSVGAAAIALHLASYAGTQGVPFHRAIAMSGASGQNFDIGGTRVSDNTAQVAATVGCRDASPAAVLACLRTTPMRALEEASVALARSLHPPFGEYSFYPQLDGDYLPARPSGLFRSGRFVRGIPTIGSWNTNDGAWYAPPDLAGDDAIGGSLAAFAPGLTPRTQAQLVARYPSDAFRFLTDRYPQTTTDYWRAAQLQRDAWFACPGIVLAWRQAQYGTPARLYANNATTFAPVMAALGFPYWRVLHLSDVPLLLHNDIPNSTIPLDHSPANRQVARDLSGSAIAFAYGSGGADPSDPLPDWPAAFDGDPKDVEQFPRRLTLQVFGGPAGTGPATVTDADPSRRDVSEREAAVQWEDLLARCRFIDAIADELGV